MVHAGMGDLETAYELFGRAEHTPYGPTLAFHHHFRDVWEDLRDDPRYYGIVDLVYQSWRVEPPGGDAFPGRDESG